MIPPQPTKLYWAYGSNLDKGRMLWRCPAAEPVEAMTVENLVLRFRHVADVAYLTGANCEGGLWRITEECEKALDDYEGYRPGGGGLYRKCYFDYTDDDGVTHKVLYYKMNRTGICPPSEGYLACIVQGYEDFGIDTARLERAVEHSWRRKDLSGYAGWRWNRDGRPKMARSLTAAVRKIEGEPEPTWAKEDEQPERIAPPKRPKDNEDGLPDVMLRKHPERAGHCLALPLTEKGSAYFIDHISVPVEGEEWAFGYSTYTVAGLLQKKGLTVNIFEKLKR